MTNNYDFIGTVNLCYQLLVWNWELGTYKNKPAPFAPRLYFDGWPEPQNRVSCSVHGAVRRPVNEGDTPDNIAEKLVVSPFYETPRAIGSRFIIKNCPLPLLRATRPAVLCPALVGSCSSLRLNLPVPLPLSPSLSLSPPLVHFI